MGSGIGNQSTIPIHCYFRVHFLAEIDSNSADDYMEVDPDLDGYWTAEGQRSSSSGVMRRAAYTTVPARSQRERPTMEEIMKAYPAYRIHSVQTPPSSASDGDGTDRIPPQRENSVESDWMLSSSASKGPPECPPDGPSRSPEGQPEQLSSHG